jgi:hypothetical protein
MSHSLCVIGVYDEVKMTVPMIVRYVHSDKIRKNVTGSAQRTSTQQICSGLNSTGYHTGIPDSSGALDCA